MPGVSVPVDWILGKARFQRNYLWDVLLPDISETIGGIPTGGLIGFGLAQLVRDVQFGDYSMDAASTMRVGPYQAHFAGMLTVDKIRITFVKTMPDAVSAYINAWKDLIVDKQGLFKMKSNYQKDIYVRFLDSTGIAFGRYKLTGCFPVTFPKYNLNYTNEDLTTVAIEFSVDKIEYEWFG
jgi:hypothetical protein